jgi:predicted transporter
MHFDKDTLWQFPIVILVFIFGLGGGCCNGNDGCKDKKEIKTTTASNGSEFEVITIEGCEYLKFYTYGFSHVYTHKGNCTNIIHKNH